MYSFSKKHITYPSLLIFDGLSYFCCIKEGEPIAEGNKEDHGADEEKEGDWLLPITQISTNQSKYEVLEVGDKGRKPSWIEELSLHLK